MAVIRLDVTSEVGENLQSVLHGMRSGLNVAFRETGNREGGGWPEIEFTGSPAHLGVVVARYCGDDLGQLGELLDRIKEVEPTTAHT